MYIVAEEGPVPVLCIESSNLEWPMVGAAIFALVHACCESLGSGTSKGCFRHYPRSTTPLHEAPRIENQRVGTWNYM